MDQTGANGNQNLQMSTGSPPWPLACHHPDTYALRRYETPRAEVSVSLKDKIALGRTFVFIRVQDRRNH